MGCGLKLWGLYLNPIRLGTGCVTQDAFEEAQRTLRAAQLSWVEAAKKVTDQKGPTAAQAAKRELHVPVPPLPPRLSLPHPGASLGCTRRRRDDRGARRRASVAAAASGALCLRLLCRLKLRWTLAPCAPNRA